MSESSHLNSSKAQSHYCTLVKKLNWLFLASEHVMLNKNHDDGTFFGVRTKQECSHITPLSKELHLLLVGYCTFDNILVILTISVVHIGGATPMACIVFVHINM